MFYNKSLICKTELGKVFIYIVTKEYFVENIEKSTFCVYLIRSIMLYTKE